MSRGKKGFTLIEASVSIVIMVMLTALGSVYFLHARDSSYRNGGMAVLEAVQLKIRANAVATGGVYDSFTLAGVSVPGVNIISGPVSTRGDASVAYAAGGGFSRVVIVGVGSTGECEILIDDPNADTLYGIDQHVSSMTVCDAGSITADIVASITSTDPSLATRVVLG